ncbi:MAG: hypothetical protein C00003105_00142 [ANME-2 cluster archaeon HR1]|nr:MAG: hypothetical protein C00003105_00142 [ANME-2 cluster archaeon HR1]
MHIVIISLDLKRDRCGYVDHPPQRLRRTETIGRNPDTDPRILVLYLLHHLLNIWKMDRWLSSRETDLVRVRCHSGYCFIRKHSWLHIITIEPLCIRILRYPVCVAVHASKITAEHGNRVAGKRF